MGKMKNKMITAQEIIGKILTDKVEKIEEEYNSMIKAVDGNYDATNKTKGKMPSLRERRKRIQMNYY